MINNNCGSAFPVNQQDDRNGDTFIYAEPGMTLRDYFAAKAMQSVVAINGGNISPKATAQHAYILADAMLKAREVGNE